MNALFALATATAFYWTGAAPAVAAPAPPANVNFAAAQGLPFSLVLDGHLMTNPVARQVHVDQLAPGRHWADFSFSTSYGQPMQFRTTVWLEPGTETSYMLVIGTHGPQLQRVNAVAAGGPVYQQPGNYPNSYPPQPGTYGGNPGSYPNSGNSYPNTGNSYPNSGNSYPNNGNSYPNSGNSYPNNSGSYPNTGNSYPNSGNSYPNNGNSYPSPAPYGTSPEEAPPTNTPATPGSYEPSAPTPSYDPNAPDPNAPATSDNALAPLPADEVQALTQELRSNSSDKARVDLAKQALAQASVSAEELAQLLGTLSLDKSRIALAEYGYAHLSDPQNFPVVYEMFHLPSSVREVQQALGIPQN